MDPIYIGIFGSTLFVIAWVYETWEEVYKHKMLVDLKFAFVDLAGVISIIVYSYLINSAVFFYLNIIILFFIVFEIAYSRHLQKNKKKSIRRSK